MFHPFLLLFMAVFLAPVFEEIIFRGYLTGKKVLQWVTMILLLVYIILSGYNPVSIVLYGLFAILFFINMKNSSHILSNYMIITNSLLFTVIHYKLSDFTDINLVTPMLSQLLLALVFSWVVINYSLIHSIITHGLVNGLIFGSSVIFALGLEDKKEIAKTENAVIEWSEDKNFFSTMEISYNPDSIVASGAYGSDLYHNLGVLIQNSDCIKNSEFIHPNNKYNIKIYLTNDKANIDTETCELLEKAKLIRPKK